MQIVDLADIREQAHQYHDTNESWHFHILSPSCVFNTQDRQYAFILEHPSDNTQLIHYSDEAQKDLGAELSPLLHRPDKVSDQELATFKPSKAEQNILLRAKELNDKGMEWHHHLLFRDCGFNQDPSKFCLILEDPETNQELESLTDNEPVEVLKLLEPLFYASTTSKS